MFADTPTPKFKEIKSYGEEEKEIIETFWLLV